MAIVIIRTAIIYSALLLAMRLMGKRQLGEMEISEFVVASLIADLAAHPLQDMGIPMVNGLVPIFTLLCFEILIAGVCLKSIRLRTLLFGRPSVLVTRGVIDQREMHKNRFTVDELMQELRNCGLFDLSQVEYAVLETDGRLNVIPYPAAQAPTAAQLKVEVPDAGSALIVVSEGHVIGANLKRLGLDRDWLAQELRRKGAETPKDVYLMTVNHGGQSYLAKKERKT